MKILVINCGSSSLKYQLLDMTNNSILASGLAERIGMAGTLLTHRQGQQSWTYTTIHDHKSAVNQVIQCLINPQTGVLNAISQIKAIGHRVVHGGEYYSQPVIIDQQVIDGISACAKLAPLHNPAHLIGIRATLELMPDTPMVAVFDTAFHQSMPKHAYLYSLPYSLYQQHKIRRFGFHGTSHQYVAQIAAATLKRPLAHLKLISCHLGNGASVTAIQGGQSIDTSMGFTPLAGLTMGTRCGDLDPSILVYLSNQLNYSIAAIDKLLNTQSGVLGISELSHDFRDLTAAATAGNQQAQLALDIFTYQVIKYIGAYAAAMNGVDGIIFTAGVGENSPEIRAKIVNGLTYLGLQLDDAKNQSRGQLQIISHAESKVSALVVPTNEELMIAKATQALVGA